MPCWSLACRALEGGEGGEHPRLNALRRLQFNMVGGSKSFGGVRASTTSICSVAARLHQMPCSARMRSAQVDHPENPSACVTARQRAHRDRWQATEEYALRLAQRRRGDDFPGNECDSNPKSSRRTSTRSAKFCDSMGMIDDARAVSEAAKRFGAAASISTRCLVFSVGAGDQQLTEIVKASQDAR